MFCQRKDGRHRYTGTTLRQTVSGNRLTVQKNQLNFRNAQEKDLDQMMTIEEVSFISPWCRETFQNELKNNHSIAIVAEWNQQITGYIIGWIIIDEIHITNLAVHPEWRRKGIAETMIRQFLAKHTSCKRVLLEVRRSNYMARSLYNKLGFHETGIRENYYTAEGEDAILMEKRFITLSY